MSRGIEAGKAVVTIDGNDKPLQGAIRKAQARLRGIAGTSRQVGAALGGIGVGIAAPLALAVKEASDLQEVMNKFNVVFGENSTAVKKWSDDYAGAVGRSQKQVAGFMAETQDLLKPMGFAADAATDMSKDVTKLAIDLASFNNMSDDDVLRDLKAALTGSGEVMKKYGVIVSEAAVKQELLNMQLDPKNASDTEKAQARLNIIMRGTTDAQGDAINSAGQYANMMKRVEGTIDDVSAQVGMALLPALESVLGTVVEWLEIGGKWIENNAELVPVIAGVAVGLVTLGTVLVGVSVVASGTAAALGLVGTVAGALASPFIAGAALAVVLGGAFLWATGALDEMSTGFSDGMESMSRAFKAGGLEVAFEAMWLSMAATAADAIASIMESLADLIDAFTDNKFMKVIKAVSPSMLITDELGGLASGGLRGEAKQLRANASSTRIGRDSALDLLERRNAAEKSAADAVRESAEAQQAIDGLSGSVDFNKVASGGSDPSAFNLGDEFTVMADDLRKFAEGVTESRDSQIEDPINEAADPLLTAARETAANTAELLREVQAGGVLN